MAIITFRGESSVTELTNKLYTRLTPLQREKAEAAIVKANPQLSNIRKLKKGSVLRIPDMPELKAKKSRNLENPDDQIVENISDSLASFNERITLRVKSEQASLKGQTALLSSAKFKKDISKFPELQALSKEAGKALGLRTKAISERQKIIDASINLALKDLKAGLR
jgi:Tfp pilus assembly protein FimV